MHTERDSHEVSEEVRRRLCADAGLTALLPAIQPAAEAHPGVYLVGGSVRDLLLGTENVDVDIAVEGDALGFARDLAVAFGGELREHERFQTALVTGPYGPIDVAATRVESYSSPGSLPQIASAGLSEDLARRDFTINAMASSLKAGDLGDTSDPFGGFRDLREAKLRVLHDSSFDDDPTRMLRAVRYAARLDLEIEDRTLELIEAAVESRRLEVMDSARVRDELFDLLSEVSFERSLETLALLKLDRALHPRLRADRAARELVANLDDPVTRLAALCLQMNALELARWLDRLSVAGEWRDAVVAAATEGPALGRRLDALDDPAPSALYGLLIGSHAGARRIAATHSARAAEMVATYEQRLQAVQLEIGGDDLLAAGVPEGPEIGLALREVLALKLDGSIGGRQDQLAAALRVAGGRGAGE